MQTHATPKEFLDALDGSTQDELVLIRKLASRHLGGTRFSDPADLVSEAVDRVISGRRPWPLRTPLPAFMDGCMKSIAHAQRKRAESRAHCGEDFDEVCEKSARLIKTHTPSVEDILLERERSQLIEAAVRRARESLLGDSTAQRVLDAMAEGSDSRAIRSSLDVDVNAYRAARERALRAVRRRLGPVD